MFSRFFVFLFVSLFILIFFAATATTGQLVYSTYLGGSDYDYGWWVAVDNVGNAYITGYAASTDFPTTAGVIDRNVESGSEYIFVSKLNATGTALIYSTYLGGDSGINESLAMAINNAGEVYISGYTNAPDFPVTTDAFDTTFNGGYDVFVSKLNSSGTSLLYSTYLGGSGNEFTNVMAVDNSGNAYIAGYTLGTSNFPTTAGAFDTTYNDIYYTNGDVFVSKLNPTGTALVYSTFLGGSYRDIGTGLTIDNIANAYITGYTISSTDFPITPGAFDTSFSSAYYYDVFVSKLNPSGSSLVYSTFLGGSRTDQSVEIVVDKAGNAYITGYTNSSTDFPVTVNTYDSTYNGGNFDIFVSKLNALGTSLFYSTYLGGSNRDFTRGITIDYAGNAYIIAASNSSTDFPVTTNAYNTVYNGGDYDITISKLNATGSELIYSTYFGGSGNDNTYCITVDNEGNAFLTGSTDSLDFPITAGAFDTTHDLSDDAFVAKLALGPISIYLNSYGAFTVSSDTSHWYWEKYGTVPGAGTLSWASTFAGQSGIVKMEQVAGEKGKLTQVFSVPSTGWYTAMTKVATDIIDPAKQQKVYIYLQELDSSTAVAATGNLVIQPGNGGFGKASTWRELTISFYCQSTLLGVQVVGINPLSSGVSGGFYIDSDLGVCGSAAGDNAVGSQ